METWRDVLQTLIADAAKKRNEDPEAFMDALTAKMRRKGHSSEIIMGTDADTPAPTHVVAKTKTNLEDDRYE